MTEGGRIAVLGTGTTGSAVARYLAGRSGSGRPIAFKVYDESDSAAALEAAYRLRALGVDVELGARAVDAETSLVIASPGIPPSSDLMTAVRTMGVRTISEIEFAFEQSRSPWVAVTGTNGKTTVASLVAHLLGSSGIAAECVGNIGDPAISAVDTVGSATTIVAEVSSFQLALTERFHPRVAVLLNITPDHIDWHGSMDRYVRDKARVFANQGPDDMAVVDLDDAGSAALANEVSASGVQLIGVSRFAVPKGGAGLDGSMLVVETPHGNQELLPAEELRIKGAHNISNALAAAAAALAMGATVEAVREGLRSFEPIAHRLQAVGAVGGVEFFNDSKATNPGATRMALTAFGDRPVVLLLGGRNKDNDFGELAVDARGCRAVIVFGEAAPEIAADLDAIGVAHEVEPTMLDAARRGARLAHPGDAVLLSPACASFDEFRGYAARGAAFTQFVNELAEEISP